MTLRFVPKFRAQIKVISNAQKCIMGDGPNGGVIEKVKNGITILSIMVTWALEDAIETADSMKSRGYGLHGRTAFSIYKFEKRDKLALTYLLLCGSFIIAGACLGGLRWRYYPTMRGVTLGVVPVSVFLLYLALCIMPLIINIREDRKWSAL
jgi:energy-coupling factor transport system permease protein